MELETKLNVKKFIRRESGSFRISTPIDANSENYKLTAEQYRIELLKSCYSYHSISSPTDEEARRYLERNKLQTLIKRESSPVRNSFNRIEDCLSKTSLN